MCDVIGALLISALSTHTSYKPATINGVEPTFDLIAAGEYPVSRALYVYIKKEHVDVVPGLKDFVRL